MVARRENFHRVYDLSHRVAPEALAAEGVAVEAGKPSDAKTLHWQFILQSVAALGITQARWVNDDFRLKPRLKDKDLNALVEEGALLRVAVEGWDAPAYVHPQNKALLNKATAGTWEAADGVFEVKALHTQHGAKWTHHANTACRLAHCAKP